VLEDVHVQGLRIGHELLGDAQRAPIGISWERARLRQRGTSPPSKEVSVMATEAALRREEIDGSDRPLRVFPAGRSDELDVEVFADRLEIRFPRRVISLEYRSIERCLACRESGRDVLAIVDRAGGVLLIPMRPTDVGAAVALLDPLIA
jgi:hypothetical protein